MLAPPKLEVDVVQNFLRVYQGDVRIFTPKLKSVDAILSKL